VKERILLVLVHFVFRRHRKNLPPSRSCGDPGCPPPSSRTSADERGCWSQRQVFSSHRFLVCGLAAFLKSGRGQAERFWARKRHIIPNGRNFLLAANKQDIPRPSEQECEAHFQRGPVTNRAQSHFSVTWGQTRQVRVCVCV